MAIISMCELQNNIKFTYIKRRGGSSDSRLFWQSVKIQMLSKEYDTRRNPVT